MPRSGNPSDQTLSPLAGRNHESGEGGMRSRKSDARRTGIPPGFEPRDQRRNDSKRRAPARLPEIDFVDAGDVRDDIEPLIIRDADIEFHSFSARSSFFAESLAGSDLSVMAAWNFVIADIRSAPLGALVRRITWG